MLKKIKFFLNKAIPSFVLNPFLSLFSLAYIDVKSKLYAFWKIKIYKGVIIEGSILKAFSSYKIGIEIGKNVHINQGCVLNTRGEYIKIGKDSTVNPYCILDGHGGLEIGESVAIATHARVVVNHEMPDNSDLLGKKPLKKTGKTIIEDGCWIGAGVTIISGVKIGKGSVIGANAVVNKDIPPFSVAVGVPAKIIKKRNEK